ncbi:MAG: GTP-binding protein LepA, GTP-binding protein LepA [Chloroflexi bacterium CSP1-4]|nr:MAG: GTP-binding protein LepA, GTP-binding protein LepA [Chloroflexi bacterium CSP1-4]
MIPQSRLRNFSIIAHIDHGKSTLADRFLELTHTIEARQMTSQVLDSMDLEREHGITIKARAVRLDYEARDGLHYGLNLIDTPGHVDFTYEVSRSLQACEGAVLVVDAAQGIEAQTLANVHLALAQGLVIVPVINKIDLPSAQPDLVIEELENILAIPREEVLLASAKEGTGVPEILEAIVARVPPPKGDPTAPLSGLIFDSHYDAYKGVVAYVRLAAGTLREHDTIRLMASGAEADLLELGVFRPQLVPVRELVAGEVGYVATGLKSVRDCQVGDTLTSAAHPATKPLPGYKAAKPLVFAGIYPLNGPDYPLLRDALEKLHLNDASISFQPESSVALGFGFRCGFLGLLHMEIIQERLEREFDLDLIASAPSVEYRVKLLDGSAELVVDNPAELPGAGEIETISEPWVRVQIVTPSQHIGALMELTKNRRGSFTTMEYLDPQRVLLSFELPLAEVIVDFFDQMKSRTQGYASMDYEEIGYRPASLVKLDVLVAGESVDALSLIVHRDRAQQAGRTLVDKLKELIPRQMFEVPIQAAIGSNVIARETVRAMRKNVIAKCYGGDITRKRKLLEKQKEGKARMKRIGSVEIPQEAFLAVLRTNEAG